MRVALPRTYLSVVGRCGRGPVRGFRWFWDVKVCQFTGAGRIWRGASWAPGSDGSPRCRRVGVVASVDGDGRGDGDAVAGVWVLAGLLSDAGSPGVGWRSVLLPGCRCFGVDGVAGVEALFGVTAVTLSVAASDACGVVGIWRGACPD